MKRLIAFALVFATGPAFAHAMLEHASPAAGAIVHATPNEIVLQFSEGLEPAFSAIDVSNSSGATVSFPPTVADRTMRARVRQLAPGTYKVKWHAVSIDTHRTEGAYTFTIKP